MSGLRVVSPGLHTTVQDLGRFGAQHLGIPVSGAMDPVNLRLANLLAGNDENGGAFECLVQGPGFEVVAGSVRLALAGPGARIEAVSGGRTVEIAGYRSFTLMAGDCVTVQLGADAAVAYLAVGGGLALPHVMGSQATFSRGALGGYKGRPLRAGDEVPLVRGEAVPRAELGMPAPDFAEPARIRIMLGPQDDYFSKSAIETFLSQAYTISLQSDRMGFRLAGPKLEHAKGFNIASDGIAPGAIQVPGSGEPIILLADRQTTGGYPKIGVVISADLPALARMQMGRTLSFQAVGFDEARKAAAEFAGWFTNIKDTIRNVDDYGVIDLKALLEQNLIGGVVDAKVSLVD
ncbi:MAG: biotin-dependent carboxyltransferase family protein [Rhodomicrobium sp.]|nr:biotin-dependent carboxyltransferase family protein [Rhodomicrobium sp.]